MEPPLVKKHVNKRQDASEQLWKELHRIGWQKVELAGEHLLSPRATGVWERLTDASSSITAEPALELQLLLECDNSLLTQKKRISNEIPRRNASTRLGSVEGIEIPILKV